jgi:hypothetical protein
MEGGLYIERYADAFMTGLRLRVMAYGCCFAWE